MAYIPASVHTLLISAPVITSKCEDLIVYRRGFQQNNPLAEGMRKKKMTMYALTSGVRAEPCKKLEANVSLAVHGACMYLENLGTALKVR